MPDEKKQDDPIQFRPYKPIRDLLMEDREEYERPIKDGGNGAGSFNMNYRINAAVAAQYGLNADMLEGYRRNKK